MINIKLIDIFTQSCKIFFYFIRECNENYRSGHDLRLYRKIITYHRENKDIEALLNHDDFPQLIYDTLDAWNMNQREAKLNSVDKIKMSIQKHTNNLKNLYRYKLTNLGDRIDFEVLRLLEKVFCDLDVMSSRRRIVGVSKAMHFLLPDLVMPIDSKYTMTCFYGYNKYSKTPEKEFETFKDIFTKTTKIRRKLNLTENDADNKLWNTSVPKLIDNASIGFYNSFMKHKNIDEFKALIDSLVQHY